MSGEKNMSDRNKSVISGFLWRFAERCGAQGVSFIVTIVLARLLNPNVYGTISIILVFAFLIFRIILQEFIISIPSLNSMAITLEKGYLKILEVLFGFVFNSLHMLFKIVPTYKVFVYQNSLLSPMAVLCLFSIILIFIIISMIKGMINLIKNKD